MNILFQRGGSALRQHFERILKACKLREDKAKDIDERGKQGPMLKEEIPQRETN